MHHFLFPTQDAYISNKTSEKESNFGLDEMLVLGVSHSYARILNTTKTYHYGNEYVVGLNFQNFTGKLTGSFFGVVYNTSGSIVGTETRFTSSYFSGSLSGSVDGSETGSAFQSTNFSGSLIGFDGNIESNIINGFVTGSLTTECFTLYTGQFWTAIGNGTGYLTGDEIKQENNVTTTLKSYINRFLIQFDLTTISQSIVSGDIVDPRFYLKVKSTEARELPVSFSIYAFPVGQSWRQGDGYFSDGGSSDGVSWDWKDLEGGIAWYAYVDTTITSSIDYLGNYNLAPESWKRGGGTWENIPCTQSFDHEVSDINMDVTAIVDSWLSGTTANNGFILMYGGETSLTASNAHMFFFSNQTNTIYSPKLDIQWDDSEYITGSHGTGSVSIIHYSPRLSGSIYSATITGIGASGSFSGNAYLITDQTGVIQSGSVIDVWGRSLSIQGLNIDGNILGTASYSGSISFITASLYTGDFSGCQITAQYSSSMITGILSGSFSGSLLEESTIYGNTITLHNSIINANQNSSVSGDMIGILVSESFDGGIFQGVSTNGLLQGASLYIPFTGSYAYLTSSLSLTSSVEITSSVLSQLDVSKPFVVVVQDMKKEYSFGDFPRIGIFGREKFPLKTFGKSPQQLTYITPKYLPTNSYYSIKDNETEEIIIDFDNYTRISCDSSGNYFFLNTTGLSQERYYRVLIRVVGDDTIYTFDANDLFKIRR